MKFKRNWLLSKVLFVCSEGEVRGSQSFFTSKHDHYPNTDLVILYQYKQVSALQRQQAMKFQLVISLSFHREIIFHVVICNYELTFNYFTALAIEYVFSALKFGTFNLKMWIL